jgi:hypothetical protein
VGHEKPPSISGWPRITLITPALNSAHYIEQTIRSVIYQGYPNLEYSIVDGGSTDGTVEIIRKYEKHLSWWVSEPDNGMYDALNKGFARSSGEIMGWISATDMLHQGSLKVVSSVLQKFPQVEWITGRPTGFNEQGMTVWVGSLPRFSQIRFLAGANRYIQQESTFWKRGLWERAGGHVDASRRNASDFELWVRFFRHAHLYPVNALIGGYRFHGDSLGLQDLGECHRIHDLIIEAELDFVPGGKSIRAFRLVGRFLERIPMASDAWSRVVLRSLYVIPGQDLAPVISYSRKQGWIMRKLPRKSEQWET